MSSLIDIALLLALMILSAMTIRDYKELLNRKQPPHTVKECIDRHIDQFICMDAFDK